MKRRSRKERAGACRARPRLKGAAIQATAEMQTCLQNMTLDKVGCGSSEFWDGKMDGFLVR
jgi:hypothetical protein